MNDNIVEINEEKVKEHLGNFVRETVEETLMLEMYLASVLSQESRGYH